ncbi:hypothetical protein Mal15_60080 [Stieleria maiorica]|uniref:Uncharacterized protein n=1 Tax=Stieleria maiorica TaxID=2795974 RepID=A0A5B9MPK6_9BACT|nr:hypothetical protein [Stieleria maiorica]QEG01927.1 hypothetical protein Mal15_60080 [Stieleria maiorica]
MSSEKTVKSSPQQRTGAVADGILVSVLRLSAFLCLAGWTWQHLYWEGPYGVLLWQDWTYDFAQWLGISWEEFVGNGVDDGWVQRWISRIGWIYLVCAILSLTAGRRSYLQMLVLLTGTGMLAVLSYAKYVAAQRQLPMLVEHGGQVLAPALLALALALGARHRVTVLVAMVAVVTTFAGHGAYALGWWPTPGNFYAMISLSLGLDYDSATIMLRIAGIMDLAVGVLLFVPPLRRVAAGYAVLWGLLTALARPVAGMSTGLIYWGADQYVHESVLRAPHFLIPLYLFLLWRRPQPADATLESTS